MNCKYCDRKLGQCPQEHPVLMGSRGHCPSCHPRWWHEVTTRKYYGRTAAEHEGVALEAVDAGHPWGVVTIPAGWQVAEAPVVDEDFELQPGRMVIAGPTLIHRGRRVLIARPPAE